MKLFFKTSFALFLLFSTLDAKEPLLKGSLERMVEPKISLESSYISDSNIKGSAGGYEVAKNSISVNNAFLGLKYTNRTFIWDNVAELPFGDGVSNPIEQMHTIKIDAKLPYKIDEKWFLVSSISATSSFEDDMKDSYSAGIFSFASYKFDDEHTMQMGAFANYHPITSLALPIVSYSYRARHQDGFKFVLGFPRTYVGYHLNKSTLLRLGMIFSQSVVKLSDESVVSKSGYLETKDYMSNFGVSYDLNKELKIQADVLYGLQREFTIYDSNGDSQNTYTVESSLGVNFKIVYLF